MCWVQVQVYSKEYYYDMPEDKNSKKKTKKKLNTNERKEMKRKERITFWWKDPVDEMTRQVTYLVNGHGLDPAEISCLFSNVSHQCSLFIPLRVRRNLQMPLTY